MNFRYIILLSFVLLSINGFCLAKENKDGNTVLVELSGQIAITQKQVSDIEQMLSNHQLHYEQRSAHFDSTISKIETEIQLLNTRVNSIIDQQESNTVLIEKLNADFQQTKSENEKTIDEISLMVSKNKMDISQSYKMNRIGSILILLALLFEIPGAIFLGGSHLANEQPHVFSIKPTPDLVQAWSFGLEKVWDRLNFFGLLASFSIIIGFLMQIIGIAFILSLPLWCSFLFIILALLLCFSIVYFLIGQYPHQSRKEKLKVFYLNLKRNFRLTNGIKCDYCSKTINQNNCQIWWIKAPDIVSRPYSGDLKKMHIGHEECLEKSGWYNYISDNDIFYKVTPYDFVENHFQDLVKWWEGYQKEHYIKKGKSPRITQYQFECDSVIEKTQRLMKKQSEE